MATIHMQHAHNLGIEKARSAAESIARQLKEKLGIAYHWEESALKFARSGANGQILVQQGSVTVEVTLGLMLRPMKSKIEKEIKSYLDKTLA